MARCGGRRESGGRREVGSAVVVAGPVRTPWLWVWVRLGVRVESAGGVVPQTPSPGSGFGIGAGIEICGVWWWRRQQGETVGDCGWERRAAVKKGASAACGGREHGSEERVKALTVLCCWFRCYVFPLCPGADGGGMVTSGGAGGVAATPSGVATTLGGAGGVEL